MNEAVHGCSLPLDGATTSKSHFFCRCIMGKTVHAHVATTWSELNESGGRSAGLYRWQLFVQLKPDYLHIVR